MERCIALLGLLMIFTGSLHAQEVVVVRFIESMAKKLSFINVTYDDGRDETIDLQGWGGMMATPASAAKAMSANQIALSKLIIRLEKEGYDLQHVSTGSGDGMINTLLLFRRKQE